MPMPNKGATGHTHTQGRSQHPSGNSGGRTLEQINANVLQGPQDTHTHTEELSQHPSGNSGVRTQEKNNINVP